MKSLILQLTVGNYRAEIQASIGLRPDEKEWLTGAVDRHFERSPSNIAMLSELAVTRFREKMATVSIDGRLLNISKGPDGMLEIV